MKSKSENLALRFSNLARRYGSEWALNGVSGELNTGEIVAIQGENGSGKSTLLLTLSGILRPHRGAIEFAPGKHAHLVAHQAMAYPQLSIRRNLDLAAVIEKKSRAAIETALSYWQIESLAIKPVRTLSRGQLQRFLLARAMVAERQILLLDEPFTGLDSAGEKLLSDFIFSQSARGVAILFSEHDYRRANALAARSIRMKAGACIP